MEKSPDLYQFAVRLSAASKANSGAPFDLTYFEHLDLSNDGKSGTQL